jgi:glycosyltransferase involved in cell wall biosynthesis
MASSTLPTVTAVVSTYNRCNYLSQSLDSLLAQTYPLTQLIVVNDGSTDGTSEVCARYGNCIEYYEQANKGKAAAINSIIPYIRGDYVWIFDDDDIAFPDAIERHILSLGIKPNTDHFSYGTSLRGHSDSEGQIIASEDRKVPNVNKDNFLITLLMRCFLSTQAMLIPTESFRRIDGFDPNLIRSQDFDLFIKISRTLSPVWVDGPLFILRDHDGLRGSSTDRFTNSERELRWYRYDKAVISNACNYLQIQEFLPKSEANTSNPSRAYLQRFAVRAVRGLWDEALPDLLEYNRLLNGMRLSSEERLICWDAMSEWLALEELFNSTTLMKTYRKAFSAISREISIPLLKGVYYSLRKNPHTLRWLALMSGLARAI